MTTHISARLAWHADGWNGHICRNPKANVYCIGQHSYPGKMISEDRDLEWEIKDGIAGYPCSKLKQIPPCVFSINAFGNEKLRAYSKPPSWFSGDPDVDSKIKYWDIEPYTICTWPYEEMYKDEVCYTRDTRPAGSKQKYDYNKRLGEAKKYFSELEPNNSLIFYYTNYSNPFSEDEAKKYVLVGISRLKKMGQYQYYEGLSEKLKEKYAGGFVWQMAITSNYPDEGFRFPYHLYMDRPEILDKIVCFSENDRNFKYATRRISDDEALVIIERFLEIVNTLIEIGDTSENWQVRKTWLESLIGELWLNRGAYPGLPRVLMAMNFENAIPAFKAQGSIEKQKEFKEILFNFLDNKVQEIPGLKLNSDDTKRVRRSWLVRDSTERKILADILTRFDLTEDQIRKIIDANRQSNGIQATLQDIIDNPYIICEQFLGDNVDDRISFNKIDHGMIPSPDLGLEALATKDDWRRFRALVVERLKREDQHAFLPVRFVLKDVNKKLSYLPEWKTHQFNENYFIVDEEELSKTLVFRDNNGTKYVYLKDVFEDERIIESVLRNFTKRKPILITTPVTEAAWRNYLYDNDSPIARKNPKEYEKAIVGQIEVCKNILDKPVCVICGEAGTGKTTVIKALIGAIERTCGSGIAIQLLAPTGKAADRIREKTGRHANTIHSFIASNGWLNRNMSFKMSGGSRNDSFKVYIIDESSMLDLELAAALFRSINWNTVQRLVFVGDPNQLPPIGRGKMFSDIIKWLSDENTAAVAMLKTNVRQIENRLSDQGTGILDLASLFIAQSDTHGAQNTKKIEIEKMLQRLQFEGDIDRDLRVEYWRTSDELQEKLINALIKDITDQTGKEFYPELYSEIIKDTINGNTNGKGTDREIIISPYRGEQYGTENLNMTVQERFNGPSVENWGTLGGIALYDKVIQVVNRGKSNPLNCWDTSTRQKSKIEVYNGEIGYVKPHGYNIWKLSRPNFRLEEFQVVFARKSEKYVEYHGEENVDQNLELAYAISVHKAQGSEFDNVFFILPKNKKALLTTELVYTGITRAKKHLTLFIEEDSSPILTLSMPKSSQLRKINSSLFTFEPIPDDLLLPGWYEDKKIFRTLTEYLVRSMSEVVIANMLFDRDIHFAYEKPLFAKDGTMYLPDFTVNWNGEEWYWEHLGMMDDPVYAKYWQEKAAWYDKNFPGKLLTTQGSINLSEDARKVIDEYFSY